MVLKCPSCTNLFVSKRKAVYCSRHCRDVRPRDNDRRPYRPKPGDIIDSGVRPDQDKYDFVERVTPGLPQALKDQLVMLISILNYAGYEIINCNNKSLKDLVEIAKNQTDCLLKEANGS